jgi:hypothetical protein
MDHREQLKMLPMAKAGTTCAMDKIMLDCKSKV